MKWWQFALVGPVCLVVAGCRTDPQIMLLERENRLQEDEIYRLRECIADYEAGMQLGPTRAPSPGRLDTGTVPPGVPARILSPAGSKATPATPDGPALLGPPTLESGEPLREGEVPDLFQKYKGPRTPNLQSVPEPVPSEENLPGPVPSGGSEGNGEAQDRAAGESGPIIQADSSRVTQLVLNRHLTGGYNADGRPGDEGIIVVIEPRDAQGRWIEAPGKVSVVVLDPALEGEAARVARWDFTAAETAAMFLKSALGRGMELEMLWPGDPPVHEELQLFVRYTTSDGRKLERDHQIRVDPPHERSADWVPSQKAAPRTQASRPAESRPDAVSSEAPVPTPAAPRTALTPAGPKIQPPVWSPDRR